MVCLTFELSGGRWLEVGTDLVRVCQGRDTETGVRVCQLSGTASSGDLTTVLSLPLRHLTPC